MLKNLVANQVQVVVNHLIINTKSWKQTFNFKMIPAVALMAIAVAAPPMKDAVKIPGSLEPFLFLFKFDL